mgnify:FL=1
MTVKHLDNNLFQIRDDFVLQQSQLDFVLLSNDSNNLWQSPLQKHRHTQSLKQTFSTIHQQHAVLYLQFHSESSVLGRHEHIFGFGDDPLSFGDAIKDHNFRISQAISHYLFEVFVNVFFAWLDVDSRFFERFGYDEYIFFYAVCVGVDDFCRI